MATIDERDQATLTDHARYCAHCGHVAGDGPFCPGCGQPIELALPQQPPRQQQPPQQRDPGPHRSSRLVLILAAGALGLVAVAAAAIIILTGSSSSSTKSSTSGSQIAVTAYRQKLSTAFAPVLVANKTLSSSLQAIDGSRSSITAARNAETQAESAVVGARGAVGVLTVPNADSTLSQQVQQALTEENGYLEVVSSTLTSPSSRSVSQLQTLATGAQTALVPLAVIAPGAGTSLTGTDNLVSWANGAAARKPPKTSGGSSSGSSSSGSSSSGSSSGGTSTPASSSTDCGGGLVAGPNTTCPFAENVKAAWDAAPGINTTLTVYSPVTHQTYTMTCAQSGAGITCAGGNNASVSW